MSLEQDASRTASEPAVEAPARARPLWVRIGLWGLSTRIAATVFVWLSLLLALGGVAYGYTSGDARFYGLVFFILAAAWYWLAIRWVDTHGGWDTFLTIPDAAERLTHFCGSYPVALVEYFQQIADGSYSRNWNAELNLLTLDEALDFTSDLEFYPIVDALRGVVLDDPNTSNHHLCLSHPVCDGCIFYLCHDGDSKVVFPNLAQFLTSCRVAKERGVRLASLHPRGGVVLRDQAGLSALITDLRGGNHDFDGDDVVVSLIASMDLTNLPLLDQLVRDENFYLAEAIGDAIECRPRTELRPLAEMCANHPHPQAAAAGTRAIAAIRASLLS